MRAEEQPSPSLTPQPWFHSFSPSKSATMYTEPGNGQQVRIPLPIALIAKPEITAGQPAPSGRRKPQSRRPSDISIAGSAPIARSSTPVESGPPAGTLPLSDWGGPFALGPAGTGARRPRAMQRGRARRPQAAGIAGSIRLARGDIGGSFISTASFRAMRPEPSRQTRFRFRKPQPGARAMRGGAP